MTAEIRSPNHRANRILERAQQADLKVTHDGSREGYKGRVEMYSIHDPSGHGAIWLSVSPGPRSVVSVSHYSYLSHEASTISQKSAFIRIAGWDQRAREGR